MIRAARESDAQPVYGLICELEGEMLDEAAFYRIFLEQTAQQHRRLLVFEQDGEIAGFLALRVERQLHHCADIAEIMELCVTKTKCGAGIGKALLAQACAMAKTLGCTQIEVACNRARESAHRFYEREGMQKSHDKLTRTLFPEK